MLFRSSLSVMSDSLRPHGLQRTRLLCPWDSLGKNTGVGCHFLLQYMKVKSESEVAQSCPTLSDPMDCSAPGSSVHGIFQARVLEWDAIASCSGGLRPLVELCVEPAGLCGRCTGVAVPLRVLSQSSRFQLNQCRGIRLIWSGWPPCIVRKDPRVPHTARRGA